MLIFELGVRSGIRASVCRICILRVLYVDNWEITAWKKEPVSLYGSLWKVLRAQSCWCAQLGTLEANLGRNDRAYTRDVGSLPIAAGIIIVLS